MPTRNRAGITLACWNVRSYDLRAEEVEIMMRDGKVDIAFLGETYQKRYECGVVTPLQFEGQVISIPGRKTGEAGGRPSMGIAFVTKGRTMKRAAAIQCKEGKWQILVVEVGKLRIIGIYISPSAKAAHWKQFIRMLSEYRHNSHPTVVCGDFNAKDRAWCKTGSQNTGGAHLSRYLQLHMEPREDGRPRSEPRYKICAPDEPTTYQDKAGRVTRSTIDFFLLSRLEDGNHTAAAAMRTQRVVGGSDHVPVKMTVYLSAATNQPTIEFSPRPHRIEGEEGEKAKHSYTEALPAMMERFKKCEDAAQIQTAWEQTLEIMQGPFMVKTKRAPNRFKATWTSEMDHIAKERSVAFDRLRASATEDDRVQALADIKRMCKSIRSLKRARAHREREKDAEEVRTAASTRSMAEISAILRRRAMVSAAANLQGDSLKPSTFTEFFADKPKPCRSVPLEPFQLDPIMEPLMAQAITKASKGKAPGPDGIPMELYKLCPALFAGLFYEMLAACARHACTIPGWDMSILIPVFKKGETDVAKSYRPLRLIAIVRKVFEMALDKKLRSEAEDEPQQFGFQSKISALMAATVVVEKMQARGGVTSIPLDLKQAYDNVNKIRLMGLAEKVHEPETCRMIAMVLQPSAVKTQGDDTQLVRTLDTGLIQGGPTSPTIYNIEGNDLLARGTRALLGGKDDGDIDAVTCFADDTVIQTQSVLQAKRGLLACEEFENGSDNRFNMAKGKSAVLVEEGRNGRGPTYAINGKIILEETETDYLGIAIRVGGPTDTKLRKRIKAAAGMLRLLIDTRILVRGMNLQHARAIYNTFVTSKWTYGCFLVPFTQETAQEINALDAGFASAVLGACRAKAKREKRLDPARSKVAKMRALLRLDSGWLRRKIIAHQFAAGLNRAVANSDLSERTRAKAQAALTALPKLKRFASLVPDHMNPWDEKQIAAERRAEWARSYAGDARQIHLAEPGRKSILPLATRLKSMWARNLAARYLCNSFPILQRRVTVKPPPVPDDVPRPRPRPEPQYKVFQAARLGDEETRALETLKLLQGRARSETVLDSIEEALATLRHWDKWARTATVSTAEARAYMGPQRLNEQLRATATGAQNTNHGN